MTVYELASQSEAIYANTAVIPVEGCLELSFICSGSATGDVSVTLTECDTSDGTFTDVADEDVYGSFALTSADSTARAGIIGYKGFKNYVKVKITGGTKSSDLAIVALKTGCRHCPTQ